LLQQSQLLLQIITVAFYVNIKMVEGLRDIPFVLTEEIGIVGLFQQNRVAKMQNVRWRDL
jgi:hypothetical protein